MVQARLRDAERVGDVGEGCRVVAFCPEDAGGDTEELSFARRRGLVGAATLGAAASQWRSAVIQSLSGVSVAWVDPTFETRGYALVTYRAVG